MSKQDRINESRNLLRQATNRNRFMVACFSIDNEGSLILDRTTHNFPVEDFDNAVQLLGQNLREERSLCERS